MVGSASKGEASPLVPQERGAAGICCLRSMRSVVTLIVVITTLHLWFRQGGSIVVSATLPDLRSAGFDHAVALLPGIGVTAQFLGKAVQPFLTDHLGPRTAMSTASIVQGIAALLMAFSTPAMWPLMATVFAASQFFSSMGWAMALGLIRRWADPDQFGRGTLVAALAYDMGDFMFTLFFAGLLQVATWRACFLLVGLLLVTLGGFEAVLLRASPAAAGLDLLTPPPQHRAPAREPDTLVELTVSEAIRHFACQPAFWCATVATTSFGMSMVFWAYATTYAKDYAGYTSSQAILLLACGAAGSVVGDVAGGFGRDFLSRCAHQCLSASLAVASLVVMSLLLAWHTTDQLDLIASYLPLIWAVNLMAIGAVWNINLSSWLMSRGGTRHASTIIAMSEVVACAVAIPFTFIVGGYANEGNFTPLVVGSWLSLVVAHISNNVITLSNPACLEMTLQKSGSDAKVSS